MYRYQRRNLQFFQIVFIDCLDLVQSDNSILLIFRDIATYHHKSRMLVFLQHLISHVHLIGSYDNAKEALGYSYLYYVNGLYKSGDVKVLSVDGAAPTDENLQSGAYPFTVYYYAVYEKGNENAEKFVNWMISDDGQACIKQAGYVPLR